MAGNQSSSAVSQVSLSIFTKLPETTTMRRWVRTNKIDFHSSVLTGQEHKQSRLVNVKAKYFQYLYHCHPIYSNHLQVRSLRIQSPKITQQSQVSTHFSCSSKTTTKPALRKSYQIKVIGAFDECS